MLRNQTPLVADAINEIHARGKEKGTKEPKKSSNVLWGRRKQVSTVSGLVSLLFVLFGQLYVLFAQICMSHFGGSLQDGSRKLVEVWPMAFYNDYLPGITLGPVLGYAGWIAFQGLLYWVLPGRIAYSPPTPGGNILPYRMNGLLSFSLTIAVVAVAAACNGAKLIAGLAENWTSFLVVANVYGLLVALLAQIKGYTMPTCEKDRRMSGSLIHDFMAGVELNPRLGSSWDLKLFHIGRLAMNAWIVIDISFMAQQYRQFGSVSNSIIIVTILHSIYVVDFFYNEEWYLATIDMAHDHFGFYLGWGSAVWLPVIYTSQAQYLSSHFVHLSPFACGAILTTGILGYILFRLANFQKDILRRTQGKCQIFGSKPRVVQAQYTTADGKVHQSLLLRSGCWGFVRHPNYVGDIVFSFATCVCCAWAHVLPYSYFIWMTLLLIHRCYRDEKRCSTKYGQWWDHYRKSVPWTMVPGIF